MSFSKKQTHPWELYFGALGITFLIYLLKSLLITGETTLVHDNLQWYLPVFHFYARNLSQGSLPLWNPFTHAGEAFYPLLMQLRLLEPLSILTVLIGKFFTSDTVLLFNWNRFILGIWMVFGLYLCLRRFTEEVWIRLCLIPLLLFSSIYLGSFHQDGILSQFLWVPWICLYQLKIFQDEDTSWKNFLFLAISIGINFQSYQFVGPTLFTFFFILLVFLFKRATFTQLLNSPQFWLKFLFVSLIVLSMAAPNLVLFMESKDFLYTLRLLPENYKELLLKNSGLLPMELTKNYLEVGLNMPYSLIPYTGAFIKVWEYIQLLTPAANPNIHAFTQHSTFGSPSEADMYIGILPWLIALWGMCFAKDAWKKVFGSLTILFGLLMMGPPGGLHRLLFPILPPLWFIRHTNLFVLFFLFGVLYFFVLGLNHLVRTTKPIAFSRHSLLLTFFSTILVYSLVMAMTGLEYPVFKFPLTPYLFMGILIIGGTFLIFKKTLGPLGIWLSLASAHIALVLTYQRDPQELLPLLFILPLSLFYFRPLTRFNRFIISCTILLDLLLAFHQARFLYSAQRHPAKNLGLDLSITQSKWDLNRSLSVDYPREFNGRPIPRYLSLLMNKPTAFAPLIRFKGDETTLNTYSIYKYTHEPRWNHFLMSRNYATLINQSLDSETVLRIFAINQLPFFYSNHHYNGTDTSKKVSLTPLSPEEITVEKFDYNTMDLDIFLKNSGSLYWADGYDRYWTATVDNVPSSVFQAYTNFKAINLSAGEHTIHWAYNPYPFKWSLISFYGFPLFSIFVLWLFQFSLVRNSFNALKPLWVKRSFKLSKH